ncbi:tripartite tricarboxylate transporter substrate binding protein [Ramlibacter henchirensis]|uniref:Tripartite tricarboxylate transporter substrate binding protein n=1 Tax=Ramlibacter henchirensis TaxID=204072 RepID=A0A4Z0BTF7_9BURK|nr:tripartite tricarboxylate transporter substrate binding protein [Ramlibacter henchirensis]TFZ02587.1 tripartite tricarboxylate transporter substrate binding protein [Ramlibacter henchirensis]
MIFKNNPTRREWLGATLAVAAASALPLNAWAQRKYPQQPVKLIVPFAAAGAIDNITRTVAQQMSRELQQSVVVENRAGAAGNIGAAAVARAQPDGYTLLVGTSATHGANPSLFNKPGYDAFNDFEPIAYFGSVPNVLVVHPQKGPRNVAELVARAKAEPGKLTYASAGLGTSLHLAGVMFERASGVQLTHVPYKGGAPASVDLMGGVVDMMFDTVAVSLPLVQSGKTRALAVASAERHPSLPEVPTFAELGFKGVEAGTWAGLFAPKGTPADVVAELRRASDAALADNGVRTSLRGMGVQTVSRSGPAFREFVQEEIRKNAQLVKAAKISPE